MQDYVPRIRSLVIWVALSSIAGALGNLVIVAFVENSDANNGLGFAALRFILGALLTSFVWYKLRALQLWEWGVVLSQALAIATMFAAFAVAPASLVVSLGLLSPLVAGAVGHLLGLDKLSRLKWVVLAGVSLSTLGLVGLPDWNVSTLGWAMCILTVAFTILSVVQYGYHTRHLQKQGAGVFTVTAGVNLLGALIVAPYAVAVGAFQFSWTLLFGALLVVLTGGVVGTWLTLKATTKVPAVSVTLASPTSTVLTILGSVLFLGQSMTLSAGTWIGIILTGIAIWYWLSIKPNAFPFAR